MTEFIIKYWMQAIFAAAIGIMGGALKRMKRLYEKTKSDNEAIRSGMKALLRAEIISTYNHYAEEKVLPIYARENLYGLFREYEALGGNGAIKDLMEIACEWPTQ